MGQLASERAVHFFHVVGIGALPLAAALVAFSRSTSTQPVLHYWPHEPKLRAKMPRKKGGVPHRLLPLSPFGRWDRASMHGLR
ncbi:hypothetical protein DFJ74DRAFT_686726 [Hyaloraphidium curvatum]|nr:hypothetical protein DFJ74DRAFT_686726 [Hyaloraphidium curvatum]